MGQIFSFQVTTKLLVGLIVGLLARNQPTNQPTNYSPFTIGQPTMNVIFVYSMTFATTVGLTVTTLSALLTEFEFALTTARDAAGLLANERDRLENRGQERTLELQVRNRELAASQQSQKSISLAYFT